MFKCSEWNKKNQEIYQLMNSLFESSFVELV